MTAIDKGALEAAWDAYVDAAMNKSLSNLEALEVAITAYLAALSSPSERDAVLEEAARLVETFTPIRPAFETEDEGGIKWPNPAKQQPIYNPESLAASIRALKSRPSNVLDRTHRHKKRGEDVVHVATGKMQSATWVEPDPLSRIGLTNSIDMREVAIYRSVDDGSWWVRPREEFDDGRFEAIGAPSTPDPYAEGMALRKQADAMSEKADAKMREAYDADSAADDIGREERP